MELAHAGDLQAADDRLLAGRGLVLLSHILLKPGYGPGGGARGHRGPKGRRDPECWKEELKEKMDEDKPEEG